LSPRSGRAAPTSTQAFFFSIFGPTWSSSIAVAVRRTITIGLAEALPAGGVVGVDLARTAFRRPAAMLAQWANNLAWAAARCTMPAACDAVRRGSLPLCAQDGRRACRCRRRASAVAKFAASSALHPSNIGGLILAGARPDGPRRFYDIREQLWRAAASPSRTWPSTARVFQNGGFSRVEAFADYISYGTRIGLRPLHATEPWNAGYWQLQDDLARHGIASAEELNYLASQWGRCEESRTLCHWPNFAVRAQANCAMRTQLPAIVGHPL